MVFYSCNNSIEAPQKIKTLSPEKYRLQITETQIDSSWGMGNIVTKSISNQRDYNWYIDQRNTGTYNFENCGPSATVMALKWADSDYTRTAEHARSEIRANGGWWYTYDIQNYLKYNNISTRTLYGNNTKDLYIDLIDNNNILILCIDTYYLKYNPNREERWGKFFESDKGSGHFIIINGYKIVNDTLYLESYDPWSWGQRYIDGSYKGQSRYYKFDSVMEAMDVWWDYMIVIDEHELPDSRSIIEEQIVDPNTIEHNYGR